jgi:hypothetical protein
MAKISAPASRCSVEHGSTPGGSGTHTSSARRRIAQVGTHGSIICTSGHVSCTTSLRSTSGQDRRPPSSAWTALAAASTTAAVQPSTCARGSARADGGTVSRWVRASAAAAMRGASGWPAAAAATSARIPARTRAWASASLTGGSPGCPLPAGCPPSPGRCRLGGGDGEGAPAAGGEGGAPGAPGGAGGGGGGGGAATAAAGGGPACAAWGGHSAARRPP